MNLHALFFYGFSIFCHKRFLQIAQAAFRGTKQLNVVQSRVFETAYKTNENLLICAPTGAGKTNVAMLTVVKEIMRNVESGVIQKDKFKVISLVYQHKLHTQLILLRSFFPGAGTCVTRLYNLMTYSGFSRFDLGDL